MFTCRRLEGVRGRKPQYMLSMSLDSSTQHLRLNLATIRRSTRLALRIVKPLADCDRIDPHALRSRSESARLAQCVGTYSYCDWPGSDGPFPHYYCDCVPQLSRFPERFLPHMASLQQPWAYATSTLTSNEHHDIFNLEFQF